MTLKSCRYNLQRFARWCQDRGIQNPDEVSRPIVEAYQRWLFHYRKIDSRPLKLETQQQRLVAVRVFYQWLVKSGLLAHDPTSVLELPRKPERLPSSVLTLEEVERVIDQADVETPSGLRDRAIMETLFSTGIRRQEAIGLLINDLNLEEETLWIHQGKGGKSRLIPIGRRALRWLEKYLREARPFLLHGPDHGHMFLTYQGEALTVGGLTNRIGKYVRQAGVEKGGACHLFRHTMATLMLEGGADIRHIQEMLGHARLDTTQIYTKVSIRHLKDVHTRTHPAALLIHKEATD